MQMKFENFVDIGTNISIERIEFYKERLEKAEGHTDILKYIIQSS